METVTLSPKFQIVIPRQVRQDLQLQPGEKIVVIEKGGHIHLVPVGPISKARGIAKGANAENIREKHDRI